MPSAPVFGRHPPPPAAVADCAPAPPPARCRIGRGARHLTDRPTKQPILNPAGAELSGRGRRAIILALTACLVMAGFVMACLVAVVLSAPARAPEQVDRESVVGGKSVSVRVHFGVAGVSIKHNQKRV